MRLIDADALDNAFSALRFDADGDIAHFGDRPDWCLHGSEIEDLIKNAPTITLGSVIHKSGWGSVIEGILAELDGFRMCDQMDYDAYCRLHDLISSLDYMQWVSVKERLPEEKQWVLCQCKAGIRKVLRLQDGYWYHNPQHMYTKGFVTHWVPLPEPPKEDV